MKTALFIIREILSRPSERVLLACALVAPYGYEINQWLKGIL